jgi:flagellar biosynthesis/type III secretory pathway M-ring protein FliF/YscJ
MRTEKPTSAASAVARFRSQFERLRRTLGSQTPALRWSLALGALAVVLLLGYLAVPVPAGSEFLRGGEKFSSGDIIKISRALDAQHIYYRVDDQGRIEIASDRIEDAKTALVKVAVGPRSIDDLGKEALASGGFWPDPLEREQRQIKVREEILGAMIRNLDGIVSAYVTLNRPRARNGLRPNAASRPTAFVWLETDGGREIRHKTVQSIQNIIVGSETDIKPDAVTVFDQKGRHYLVAGDPKYSTISHTRAREEDLDERILEQIDWVKGVRVTVQLVPVPASTASSNPAPTPAPAAVAVPPSRVPEPAGSSVAVNAPLELEPESPPDPGPTSGLAPTPTPVVAASTLPEPPGSRMEVARVWVRVPRSYYLTKAALGRDPSPDRLQPFVEQTESLIRAAVAHVVPPELTPPGEPPDVTIDIIPDEVPTSVSLRSQVVPDSRRTLSWWIPAGVAGGCLVVVLSALGVRVLAWRRPAAGRVAAARPGRYRSDAASEPGAGPAERVRELIRLNPEAAASVLHRWIGQGESLG